MKNTIYTLLNNLLDSKFVQGLLVVGIPLTFGCTMEGLTSNRDWKWNLNPHYQVEVQTTEPSCNWNSYRFLDFTKAREFARGQSGMEDVSHVHLYNKTWCFEPSYFKGEIHTPTNGEHPLIWDRNHQ